MGVAGLIFGRSLEIPYDCFFPLFFSLCFLRGILNQYGHTQLEDYGGRFNKRRAV